MTQETETPPQAECRAYLAEHMWVECSEITTKRNLPGSAVLPCHPACICHGSGRRYLLRRECLSSHGPASIIPQNKGECWANVPLHSKVIYNDNCHGLGYVYDDRPNALTEAIREKGWVLAFDQGKEGQGDMAFIWNLTDDGNYNERIGFVSNGSTWIPDSGPDKGYRWPEVAEVALYRACRGEAE